MKNWSAILLLLSFCLHQACSQNPLRFKKEVEGLVAQKKQSSQKRNPIVFTGSSSIRLWTDLEKRFADKVIVNTGFGGSHMSDLLYWADDLIISFSPSMIFIYEGDNDLAEGKSSAEILRDAANLLDLIHSKIGENTKVNFITPKPSILRWHLRGTYEAFIVELKNWASKQKNVSVVDIWSPMLDENGALDKTLFLDDDLHINSKGYDIWTEVIRPFVE